MTGYEELLALRAEWLGEDVARGLQREESEGMRPFSDGIRSMRAMLSKLHGAALARREREEAERVLLEASRGPAAAEAVEDEREGLLRLGLPGDYSGACIDNVRWVRSVEGVGGNRASGGLAPPRFPECAARLFRSLASRPSGRGASAVRPIRVTWPSGRYLVFRGRCEAERCMRTGMDEMVLRRSFRLAGYRFEFGEVAGTLPVGRKPVGAAAPAWELMWRRRKEIVRLNNSGWGARRIAARLGIGSATLRKFYAAHPELGFICSKGGNVTGHNRGGRRKGGAA